MSVEALLGTDVAFAAAYQLARPHPGQIAVAAELRHLLRDSALQTGHHGHAHKVQDPYSLRCVPQVHGAVRDALDHLRRVLDIELNSATDNPLVFPGGGVADEDAIATGGGRVISGGNFHGEPIALALDFAKLALAELGSISERRTALLVDARLNGGLPPFLAPASGIDSRDDDLPVHGGRPRVGEQGPRPPGVGRLDPDEREPGGPRLDGLDRGAPRPDGPRPRRADPGHRAARRGAGARPAAAPTPTARRPGPASPRRCGGSAAGVRHLDGDREPGPDLAAATALVHERRARRPRRLSRRPPAVDFAPDGTIRIVDVTDEATFGSIPPCADPGFDHRSCDYWEDADRGSKAARLSWLEPVAAALSARRRGRGPRTRSSPISRRRRRSPTRSRPRVPRTRS